MGRAEAEVRIEMSRPFSPGVSGGWRCEVGWAGILPVSRLGLAAVPGKVLELVYLDFVIASRS